MGGTIRSAAMALAIASAACASRSASPTSSADSASPATTEIAVERTIVTPDDARSVSELRESAARAFEAERYVLAAREYDRIAELDPDGPHAREAWFRAASSHDLLGKHIEALARYEQVVRRYPGHHDARQALVRAVRLAAFLERWDRAGELGRRLLDGHDDLTAVERVVANSGVALSFVFGDDPEAATKYIEGGRTTVEEFGLDTAGQVPRDLAQLYFALGELRRHRGERIRFVPVPDDFVTVLERRCRLLLDAQSAYSDAMRAHDAHWSAMAGFRVGQLYEKLHVDLMAVPPPKSATTRAKADLFEGAMRLRYAILLDKGLAMMDHTLSMAERTGEKSRWVREATQAKQRLEEARKEQDRAIDRLPYSRAQLRQALADLADRKSEPRKTSPGGAWGR